MKIKGNTLITYIITYFMLVLMFVGTLTIATALPDERIKQNIADSLPIFEYEGVRYNPFHDRKTIIDGFTDMVYANIILCINSSDPFKSALASPFYVAGSVATGEDSVGMSHSILQDLINGTEPDFNYARYWHGYIIWLRPLLMLFDYQQSRNILFVIIFFLAFVTMNLIYNRIGYKAVIAFFISLCSMYFVIVPMCWSYVSVFFVIFVALIYIMFKFKDADFIKNIPYIFFIIGAWQVFLDGFDFPILAFGIPIVLVFLIIHKYKYFEHTKQYMILYIKIGVSGLCGFVLLWITKWVLADLFFGLNIISDGITSVLHRTVGETYDISFFQIININIRYMFAGKDGNVNVFLFMTIAVMWAILYVFFGKPKRELHAFLPIIITSVIPYFWYVVLKNHTSIHYNIISFKQQAITVFSIVCILLFSIDEVRLKSAIIRVKDRYWKFN